MNIDDFGIDDEDIQATIKRGEKMKVIKTKVYEFKELSKEAKEKAINWYRESVSELDNQIFVDDFSEDIRNIFEENCFKNVKVEEWDLSCYKSYPYINVKSASIEIDKFIKPSQSWIKDSDIDFSLSNNEIEVYKENDNFSKRAEAIIECLKENIQAKFNEVKGNLIKNGLANLEYMDKDSTIIENIEANEYTFLENGKRF